MISIDRYMVFSFPLRYGHVTNKRLTVIKIAVVWIMSFCIAGPLFVLSMLDSRQSLHHYKGNASHCFCYSKIKVKAVGGRSRRIVAFNVHVVDSSGTCHDITYRDKP